MSLFLAFPLFPFCLFAHRLLLSFSSPNCLLPFLRSIQFFFIFLFFFLLPLLFLSYCFSSGHVYLTDCVMAEMEKLGLKYRLALRSDPHSFPPSYLCFSLSPSFTHCLTHARTVRWEFRWAACQVVELLGVDYKDISLSSPFCIEFLLSLSFLVFLHILTIALQRGEGSSIWAAGVWSQGHLCRWLSGAEGHRGG